MRGHPPQVMFAIAIAIGTVGASCGFSLSPGQIGTGGDGGGDAIDSATDAPRVDAPAGFSCYGTALVEVCFPAPPTGSMSLSGQFDTDGTGCTLVVAQTTGPDLCVFAAAQLSITASVVATGSRAFVMVAADTISVSGTLDASSTNGGRRGAGSNPITCTTAVHAAGSGARDAGGGGGGAGGTFGTAGGAGGQGDHNSNNLPAGPASPGTPGAIELPSTLRGGCPGGEGGAGQGGADLGGQPGSGGGAIYLIAATSIDISGRVFASGAGGTMSTGFQDGGGGGGSGGMIGIDAPAIVITGRVAANGGGGSGGGGDSGGGSGGNGTTDAWNIAAVGGTAGPTVAGPGGTGTAIGMTSGTTPTFADAGGGGGGGGLGVVRIDGSLSGGSQISPAPLPH